MAVRNLLLAETRRALRSLLRTPGFSLAVVAVFALGVGVTTAMWSAFHALLLAPLPFPAPERLVALYQVSPDMPERPVSPANFLDWRRRARSFSGLAAWNLDAQVVVGAGEPRRLDVAWASANLFEVLDARAATGRLFQPGDQDAAVLSHALWQEAFAGGEVIGRALRVDGRPVEVLGVAPPELDFPPGVRLWALAPRDVPPLRVPLEVDITTLRDARYLGVLGRLAPGVGVAAADAELASVARQLASEYPESNAQNGAKVLGLAADLGGETRRPLSLLLGAAALVLLVGCLNVSGLLLARAARRQRSLAIRSALGGDTLAVVLPAALETLLLAAAGGGLGVLLAGWAAPRVLAALPDAVLGGRELRTSAAVVAFAVAITLLGALLAAGLPILASRRHAPARLLGSARGTAVAGRARGRVAMVVAQVALAFVLLAGAGLLLRTLLLAGSVSPGFRPAGVLTARLALPATEELAPETRRGVLARAVEAAATVPGVSTAGAVLKLPLTGSGFSADARVEGRTFASGEAPDVCWRAVTPGYFATVGLPVLRGRGFGPADGRGSAPTALVNRTLADRLWPGQDPVGRRLATGLDGEGWVTVVGVVADAPQVAVTRPALPEMYRPLLQESRFGGETAVLVVRAGDGFSYEVLRNAVLRVSPLLVMEPPRPLADVVRDASARERLLASVVALFGTATLLLAALGLYALLAFLVAERSREVGVRLALGAAPRTVASQVVRGAILQVAAGAALGLVVAAGVLRLLRGWLADLTPVAPWDPMALAGSVAVLAVAALLASWLPARRAARVDPAVTLRGE